MLLIRGFVGSINAVLTYACMKLLTLSVFSILTRTSIFLAILYARIFLKENLNGKVVLLGLMAFLGIILIIDPKAIGLDLYEEEESEMLFRGSREEWHGVFLAFLLVNGMAFLRTFLRILTTDYNISILQNIFWMHFGLLHWCVLLNFEDPFIFKFGEILNYLIISISSGCYQYFLVEATRYEKNPAVILIIQSLLVVLSYAIDVLAFGKEFGLWNLSGSVLVVTTSVLALVYRDDN